MAAQAIETVVAQLLHAGLNLYLAPADALAVAPSSHLTDELRTLIRRHKAALIDWLAEPHDVASRAPEPPTEDPSNWKGIAAAYYAHHFSCSTCVGAGRGRRYGQRCSEGLALWQEYSR